MTHWKEIVLPLILTAVTALDALNYGPHESGIVYLRLIPLLFALAVCVICGGWLGRQLLCLECDRECFAI